MAKRRKKRMSLGLKKRKRRIHTQIIVGSALYPKKPKRKKR